MRWHRASGRDEDAALDLDSEESNPRDAADLLWYNREGRGLYLPRSEMGVGAVHTITMEAVDRLERRRPKVPPEAGYASSVGGNEIDDGILQRFADDLIEMSRDQTRRIALAWDALAAGKIDDPKGEGEVFIAITYRLLDMLAAIERDWHDLDDGGFSDTDLSSLTQARGQLNDQADRLRKEWPLITPEEIEGAKNRHDSIAHPRHDDAARSSGYAPEEAPRELPVPGWRHLVSRRHPWKKQLFIRGRNMTVRQLVGTVRVNGWNEEDAAEALDLPAGAIREATSYADANKELLAAEAEYELLALSRRGLGRDARPVPR